METIFYLHLCRTGDGGHFGLYLRRTGNGDKTGLQLRSSGAVELEMETIFVFISSSTEMATLPVKSVETRGPPVRGGVAIEQRGSPGRGDVAVHQKPEGRGGVGRSGEAEAAKIGQQTIPGGVRHGAVMSRGGGRRTLAQRNRWLLDESPIKSIGTEEPLFGNVKRPGDADWKPKCHTALQDDHPVVDAKEGENQIDSGLSDFSFSGHQFTWEKSRGKPSWIQAKLDRILVSDAWKDMFGCAEASSIVSSRSDHLPILLTVTDNPPLSYTNRQKFENLWLKEA
nr:uncharacterized protein LOC109179108 [Ipomoea batatas]